jgi:hypothetical protein
MSVFPLFWDYLLPMAMLWECLPAWRKGSAGRLLSAFAHH